jgi:hypothetical protein
MRGRVGGRVIFHPDRVRSKKVFAIKIESVIIIGNNRKNFIFKDQNPLRFVP